MGLLGDSLKKFGAYANSTLAEIEDYKEKYRNYSDARLLDTIKSTSGTRQRAAILLAKERGLINQ